MLHPCQDTSLMQPSEAAAQRRKAMVRTDQLAAELFSLLLQFSLPCTFSDLGPPYVNFLCLCILLTILLFQGLT